MPNPHAPGVAALLGAGLTTNPYVSVAMSLAGLYAFESPLWALPTLFLTRSTAAFIVVSNLGGFVEPFAIGYIKGSDGSFLRADAVVRPPQ